MDNEINIYINKQKDLCDAEFKRYKKWLSYLRFPNLILIVLGSLLAFLGGALILKETNS